MNTKNIRLLVVGVAVGMVLMLGLTSGVFNEAGQAKEATVAWCAGTCQ